MGRVLSTVEGELNDLVAVPRFVRLFYNQYIGRRQREAAWRLERLRRRRWWYGTWRAFAPWKGAR
jgi:hypothetical protein